MEVPWIPPPITTIDFGAVCDIVSDEKAWLLLIVAAKRSWCNFILLC